MQSITTTAAPVEKIASAVSHRFGTIEQTAKVRPIFTPAALRDLKFRAFDRQNSRGEIIKGNGTGAAGVWIQIGRKVLVDLDALDHWIDGHRSMEKKL